MESLVDKVSECMEPHNVMGPLGYRWQEEDQFWTISVYPLPVELVGGDVDGEIVSPGFSLDLQELMSAFKELEDFHWCAHAFSPYDLDGPHISFEGMYQGHHIYLEILSDAPEDEEPGLELDISGKSTDT
jgi:hypothetical protein